jgi:hypothetical protein
MNNQCVERIIPREAFGGFHPHQCSRKGVVEQDGKWYCTQHDPVRVKERRADRSAKYQVERDERNTEWELQSRKNQAWDAMVDGQCDIVGRTWDGWFATKLHEGGSGPAAESECHNTPWDAVLDLVEKVKE